MGRDVLDPRRTGYGIIKPGAREPKPKPPKPPKPDNLDAIKAKIADRKAQNAALRGAKILKKRTGK